MSLQRSKEIKVTENGDVRSFILSADPNTAMREMMQTIDVLRNIYVRETGTLASADIKGFLELQDEKLLAARRYQRGVEEIITRRDEMQRVNPAVRERLEQMQREFQELTKENLSAIERMQRCVERLGNTIRNAARDAARKQRAFSYNEMGRIQGHQRKALSTGSVSETA